MSNEEFCDKETQGHDSGKTAYRRMVERLDREGRLDDYKKQQNVKSKVYRALLSVEGKKNYNKKAAQRMQKYRDKKQEIPKKLTRADGERMERNRIEMREYNRKGQRKHREKLRAKKQKTLLDVSTSMHYEGCAPVSTVLAN